MKVTKSLGSRPPAQGGTLRSMHAQGMTWPNIFGEIIDNSLDAGASEIIVRIVSPTEIRFKDNGVGCPDLGAMLVPGERVQHRSTESGEYGIGLKDSATSLWGETIIETTHAGVTRRITIVWDAMCSSKDQNWIWPDYTEELAPAAPSGTEIVFRNIVDKRVPSVSEISNIIGFWFSPALRSGKCVIKIDKSGKIVECTPKDMPPLTDIIEDRFALSGKEVKLRAGIVADGVKNEWQGLTLEKAHRVIERNAISCNGYSTRRIAGRVELGRKWTLTKHKDKLVNRDALESAVFDRIEAILKKAHKAVEEIALAEIAEEVAKALAGGAKEITKVKERRNSPSNGDGTHAPGDGKRRRRRVQRVQPGDKNLRCALSRGLIIDWADDIPGRLIADVNLRVKPPRVTLNLDHPAVQIAKETSDRGDKISIAALVVAEFSHAVYNDKQAQLLFPQMGSLAEFPKTFSAAMRRIAESVGTK